MASLTNDCNASEIFQGQALLYKHLFAFIDCMCLKWTVDMNIPNIIHTHGHPITLHELVSVLQVPPTKVGNVKSLMRSLAHSGFFEILRIKEDKEAYGLTAASKLLVKDTNFCLAPFVEFALDPTMSASYYQLKNWIYAEDLSLFDLSLGFPMYEFLNRNPEKSRIFDEAMASDSQLINLALRDSNLVFEGLNSIVDVGGGTGTTAKVICETFPELKCIVFDRPQVVENLSESDNLTYVGGDMFISIPKADAVLLKYVLHNWNDKDCLKILEKCREAIPRDRKIGKVIIMDIVINEKEDEHGLTQIKLLMDVAMGCQNGKERNEEEWNKLFTEAGFNNYKISPFTGTLSLIEIYP